MKLPFINFLIIVLLHMENQRQQSWFVIHESNTNHTKVNEGQRSAFAIDNSRSLSLIDWFYWPNSDLFLTRSIHLFTLFIFTNASLQFIRKH